MRRFLNHTFYQELFMNPDENLRIDNRNLRWSQSGYQERDLKIYADKKICKLKTMLINF